MNCGRAWTSTSPPGELIAVLGPSGSGKTTLLRAILGLERAERRARSRSLGEPVRGHGNRRIGYIPQQRPLPPGHGAARPRSRRPSASTGTASACPIPRRGDRDTGRPRSSTPSAPRDFADRPVGVLSGGEQQRLRVGQALADDPALLLCDEPLTSLDLANQQAVIGLIDRHRTRARTPPCCSSRTTSTRCWATSTASSTSPNGRFTLGHPGRGAATRTC